MSSCLIPCPFDISLLDPQVGVKCFLHLIRCVPHKARVVAIRLSKADYNKCQKIPDCAGREEHGHRFVRKYGLSGRLSRHSSICSVNAALKKMAIDGEVAKEEVEKEGKV